MGRLGYGLFRAVLSLGAGGQYRRLLRMADLLSSRRRRQPVPDTVFRPARETPSSSACICSMSPSARSISARSSRPPRTETAMESVRIADLEAFGYPVPFKTTFRGEPVRVRLDANNHWRTAEACTAHMKALPGEIFAIEEPLQAGDFAGLARVADELGVRIILDESLLRVDQLDSLDGTDRWIVNVRVSKMGGLNRSPARSGRHRGSASGRDEHPHPGRLDGDERGEAAPRVQRGRLRH